MKLPGPTPLVVACHCVACQRRSGSPFGVTAYYPAERLAIAGPARMFERNTDEGNVFRTYFCATCGSTVYVKSDKHPALIGIPVGAIADPTFPGPVRSVWEQTMHGWAAIPGNVEHFAQGRG
ncbi:GFA family protein [Sphingomonas faeni]